MWCLAVFPLVLLSVMTWSGEISFMMVIPRKREVCVMNNIKSLEALGLIYNFIRGFEGAYSWGACIWGGL